jgi:hypothetical protein
MKGQNYPSNFGDAGKHGDRHMMRCTLRNDKNKQCQHVERFTSKPNQHKCKFPSIIWEHITTSDTPPVNAKWMKEQEIQLMNQLVCFFCNFNIPLSAIQSGSFRRLLKTMYMIQPEMVDEMEAHHMFTQDKFSDWILKESDKILTEFFELATNTGIIHIAMDEGTVHHRHYLDIVLFTPFNEIKPIVGFSKEQDSFTAGDVATFFYECIQPIESNNCNVCSIMLTTASFISMLLHIGGNLFYSQILMNDAP